MTKFADFWNHATDEEREAVMARVVDGTINRQNENRRRGECPKCGVLLKVGQAIQQTYTGVPDFAGDAYPVTVSPGGPGKLVSCLKCPECGYSQ